MSYGKFAKTYDKLMDKTMYPQWKAFVDKYAKEGNTVLELACGAGDLAVLLAKDYQVIASDLSSDMLSLAQDKLSSNKETTVTLLQMDMCDLAIEQSVDIVTCFLDSLCYLPDEESVQRAFHEAYRIVKKGGYYLFDVHSLYKMEVGYQDYQFSYVDDETVFVWESFQGEHPYSVEHYITCCQTLKDTIERYDEVHYQRTYPLKQYKQWLEEAGFSVQVTANFGQDTVEKTSERWFFVCQKQ